MRFFGNEIVPLNLTEARAAIEQRDAPQGQLSPTAIFQWLHSGEGTVAGEIVNESNAMKIVTVYGCVRVIAESVASLPLKLMERTPTGHQEATDQNLYYLLAVEPNPDMSAYTFVETMIGSLALTGNSYAQIERNSTGQVVAIWPLHPFKTQPVRDPLTKAIYYETSDGMPINQFRKVPGEDILHLTLFSLDGLKGISPIEMCRQALGLSMAQEKFAGRFYGNGSTPGGILMNKGPRLDPKAQQELRESWNAQQGGVNQGKTAFLFGTEWSYQQLGISNEASQFLQSRAFSRSDIAAGIFRVPPHMVGDMSRLSGNNAEQQGLQFATYTLQPYISRFELEIIRKLMPTTGRKANKFFVQFSVDALLRADFKTQQEGYSAGRQGGWYSANDVLRKLGENPGGKALDVYIVPVNYQNAERLLDTESIQDQAIDADVVAPTEQEKKSLSRYTNAYLSLYSDAFRQLMRGNKRDLDTLSTLFRPVLRCIADTALGNPSAFPSLHGDSIDGIITDALRSMSKRAAKWAKELSDEDAASIRAIEFNKIVRSIHIAAQRELAAARAVDELETKEETDDEQTTNQTTN